MVALVIALAWASTDHFRAFGGTPSPSTLARMRASGRFEGGQFENQEPTSVMREGAYWGSFKEWAMGKQMREPSCPLPLVSDTAARLAVPPASGLRLTWLGHSTVLVEIDGRVILTDPIWSDRASPSRWVGPRRFHPPPIAVADLPHLDAVVISHEHYDHLDMETVRALSARGTTFHVPLGIGAHLAVWGVPEAQIREHDWWESAELGKDFRIVSTPARHFNGRGVPWRTGAHWTSWSLVGPEHRVFFSGDTGLTEALREIAAREGPFDLALLEIGQYDRSWGDIHLGPRGALDALARLGTKTILPIHWGTFSLGYHAWSEPPETLVEDADAVGVSVLTPRLGEPVEPALAPRPTRWWRALPPISAHCP
jgi:L-ascorbate metabolism protein UlaG (beta-lactamase superfamily)